MNITQIIRDIVTGVTFHALVAKTSITSLDELFIIDSSDSNKLKKVVASNVINSSVRQTIQTGLKDANGYCAITAPSANLTLTLLASPTEPVTAHAWGGAINKDRWCEIISDMTLPLPASQAAVYCYIDIDQYGVPTLGYSLLKPKYQRGGTISTVDGQFTCDISAGKCYVGVGGASYVQVWRVFFQESVTSASAITTVTNYAINGQYDSGYTSTIPASSTIVTKNHNLGMYPLIYKLETRVDVANNGFAVGETVQLMGVDGSVLYGPIAPTVTDKVIYWLTGSGSVNGVRIVSRATCSVVSITAANFSTKLIAERGW